MRFSLVRAAICVVLLAGCGSSSDDKKAGDSTGSTTAAKPEKTNRCETPSKGAAVNLQNGTKGKLTALRMVRSKDQGDLPGFQRSGLYIVAAVSGDRRLVWAASGEFVKTGGGLAVGLDDDTRQVSQLGADLPLDSAGVSMGTDGVTEALTCAAHP